MPIADAISILLFGAGIVLGLYSIFRVGLASDRPQRLDRYCRRCHHDLAGIPCDAKCPECGSIIRWRGIPSIRFGKLFVLSSIAGVVSAAASVSILEWTSGMASFESAAMAMPFVMPAPVVIGLGLPFALSGLPRRFVIAAALMIPATASAFALFVIVRSNIWGMPDGQSGFVVLAVPFAQLSGSGLGFWLAYLAGRPLKSIARHTQR